MKQLYKLVLATCLLLPYSVVLGQTGLGFPTPAFRWKCPSADSLLNFHPATIAPLHFDSIPYAGDYTVVVVYKPIVDTEATVWQLVFADSSVRGLTTERIVSDGIAIRYAEHTSMDPVINTLRQSAPDSTTPFVRLMLGGDSLQGSIKIAEIMYFNKRLDNSSLRRVQSALAVRYGITLGPVDYVNGDGTTIWEYADSGLFHHRITGIGRDSSYNLYQLGSRSEMDGAMLTIATDSIAEHGFLLVGDNDAPLAFAEEDDGVEVLGRQWRIQGSGMDFNSCSLSFDTRNLSLPTDSLVLLMDGYIVLPALSNSNMVQFDNVWFPSDTCSFTLARGTLLWQLAQSGTKGAKGPGGNDDNTSTKPSDTLTSTHSSFSIYPNPTMGQYFIEVSGAKHVHVVIYNMHGSVVATYLDNGKESYFFNGDLPSGNAYYATIATESGSQTMKLVVK